MAQHTPGPWILDDPIHAETISADYHYIQGGVGALGSLDNPKGFSVCGYMSIHDAKLIAASPDLLAAARLAYEFVNHPGAAPVGLQTKAFDALRAAIKKATA